MNISVIVATYGDPEWEELAHNRAVPSADEQEAFSVVRVHLPMGTIAEARNLGAEDASGDWLCFLDADDELAPGFIAAMQNVATDERTLYTPAVQQLRKGRPRPPFFFPECSFETGNWLIIGTLVSKRLFDEVGGFHEHPHGLEDFNFWARCVRAGAEIVKVPKAVYVAHYNQKSKHHMLARDRPAYMRAYEAAVKDAWG